MSSGPSRGGVSGGHSKHIKLSVGTPGGLQFKGFSSTAQQQGLHEHSTQSPAKESLDGSGRFAFTPAVYQREGKLSQEGK